MKKNLFILLLLLFCPVASFAARHSFPFPPALVDEVRFWRMVFGTYHRSQVIVHDSRYLNIVYEVIDFSPLNLRGDLSHGEKGKIRARRIQADRAKIIRSLRRLASRSDPAPLTSEEKQIQMLFAEIPGPDKYLEAVERVRVQMGQSDHLTRAMLESMGWIGDIEAIFERDGLPRELVALMFIESMFNPEAVSEVGASGLWQFMPDTGRDYLSINLFWDNRNDPIQSSLGAARFLKDLYEQMGDWALTINAYHSGPARLLKAVKELKTRDISEIIDRFQDPGYQFYSRNYYPEFLAVAEIYHHRDEYLGPLAEGESLRYDIVKTRDFVNLPEIAGRYAIHMDLIAKLNTALRADVLVGKLPLPPNYILRVPKGYGYPLAAAIGYASVTQK
ncbi:MAG: lytic transglycosylase domain-containing protein [Deltaproteobacteria bacterium]|nr:lytic transglycosylase domain-containing protein [Deltaproteobacteria bacterium]MBI4373874.1 lytic transglycosylase domain-containing protein [Deltaproteobacteria bacterium]